MSDSFLDTTVPLLVLIEAAKNGREKEIKEYASIFHEHTNRLVEVSVLKFYSKSWKTRLSFCFTIELYLNKNFSQLITNEAELGQSDMKVYMSNCIKPSPIGLEKEDLFRKSYETIVNILKIPIFSESHN